MERRNSEDVWITGNKTKKNQTSVCNTNKQKFIIRNVTNVKYSWYQVEASLCVYFRDECKNPCNESVLYVYTWCGFLVTRKFNYQLDLVRILIFILSGLPKSKDMSDGDIW